MLSPVKTFIVSASQNVQKVIDNAPDNSRIIFRPGIYREHLIIENKRIQLVAETPPNFTATNSNSAPSFSVVFDGVNAKPAWNGGQSMVQVVNSKRLERDGDSFETLISGIEIRNNGDINSQGQSGGITANNSDVIIKGTYLHDLRAHDGAAISSQNGSKVTAVNNLIWNNQAKRWGAVFDTRSGAGGSIYSSNNFKQNKAAEGSAFYQDFGTGFFLSNLVQDGESKRDPGQVIDSLPDGESKGAVMLRKDSTQSIILNQFVNNKVVSAGRPHSGAINIETEGTSNNILLNTFVGNSVGRSNNPGAYGQTGSGGAIGVFNNSNPIIQYNLFQANKAGYGGSAIAASERAQPQILNNLFYSNSVDSTSPESGFRFSTGALFFENTSPDGRLKIQNNYFEANSAGQSPDIYFGDSSSGDLIFNTFSNSSPVFQYHGNETYAFGSIGISSSTNAEFNFVKDTFVPLKLASGVSNPVVANFSNSNATLYQTSYSEYQIHLLGSRIESSPFDKPFSVNTSSALDLISTPALAVDSKVSSQGVVNDVEGYDRSADTLTGAYETARKSTTQEMNVTVWRFRKGYGALAHFYTANEQEKNDLINISQNQQSQGKQVDWIFEGAATNYHVSKDPLINYANSSILQILSPVYRFFNPLSGTHLYTIDSKERDAVLTDLPHYVFEGIAYYALSNSGAPIPPGGGTLERFFNTRSNSHFYTADPDEFQKVYANQDALGFKYDGKAFIPGL